MRYLKITLVLLALAMISGCAYPDLKKPIVRNYLRGAFSEPERPPEPRRVTVDRLDSMLQADMDQMDEISPDRYILGPGDVLNIIVHLPGASEPEAQWQSTVDSRGTIRCPLLDSVHVDGLRVAEISKKMVDLYSDGYFRHPAVEVSVLEFKSRRVMATGLVSNPGAYPVMGERTTLLHVLIEAGGLAQDAGSEVSVSRAAQSDNGSGNSRETITINLDKLIKDGDLSRNIWLYPGDIVHVPPEGPPDYFYVQGFVRAPGPYELPRNGEIGMMDAIAHARGLAEAARVEYVYLIRNEGAQQRIYNVDLGSIAAAKEPDVRIMPDDKIVVGTDWWRRSIDGLLRATGLTRFAPTF